MKKLIMLSLLALALLALVAAGRTDDHRRVRRQSTATPTATATLPAPAPTPASIEAVPVISADVQPCDTCPSYLPTPPDGPTPIVGLPCADNPTVFCPATPVPSATVSAYP